MLVARVGHCSGWKDRDELAVHAREWQEGIAREEFPLTPKRVLREERDPNGLHSWKFEEGAFWIRPPFGEWRKVGEEDHLTPAHVDLWHSLKHEPYREVPDMGDE
jgi:hypothetical protein